MSTTGAMRATPPNQARGKRAGALAIAMLAVAALGGLSVAAAACSSPDSEALSTVDCGDFETFGRVSAVLEQRCGTIDCHGSFARPFRVYGPVGLRKPVERDASADAVTDYSEYYPGGGEPTTNGELLDNYRSLCGLEPELMTRVVQGQAEPEELLVLKKARLLEKHKGGKVFNPAREGDLCLTTWMESSARDGAAFDPAPCELELSHP